MDDVRLEWIKEIVCKCLDVADRNEFDELFERDSLCAKTLYSFITGSKEKRCAFFYVIVEEEEVELELSSLEALNEVDKEQDESHAESSVTLEFEESEAEKPNSDIEEKEVPDIGDEEHHDGSEEGDVSFAPSQVLDEETIEKKFMKQIVQKKVLHMCVSIGGHIPGRRYVYLLLRKFEAIPFLENSEDAAAIMKDYFEVGLINEHLLMTLLEVISMVYLPLLSEAKTMYYSSSYYDNLHASEIESARCEFLNIMKEFSDNTRLVVEQLKKPFPFELPFIHPGRTIEELADDNVFVSIAEDLMKCWNETLEISLKKILNKEPFKKDPFSEIVFWKERKSELSTVSDHLSNHLLQKVLKTLLSVNNEISSEFAIQCELVTKQMYIANDNMTYLQNLEPYLKGLMPESTISDAIPVISPLLNVLKLVWTLSEYYGKAENMGRLIEGLGYVLQNKVLSVANVKQLFNNKFSEIPAITKECSVLLREWKSSYLKQRDSIETYEGLHHWYFSIKTLFEKTDYMASICEDLAEIAEKVEHLENVFQSNAKSISRESEEFDRLEESVLAVPMRVQYVDFDLFMPKFQTLWANLMEWFHHKCDYLQTEIKAVIDKTFSPDLNFESAMMLIRSFNKINTSQSIKDFIQEKHSCVLDQYCKEVQVAEKEFLANKDMPPEYKSLPALTSAVIWERSLLLKIKTPILEFRKGKEFLNSKKGRQVQDRYLQVARRFKAYENEKYEAWKEDAVTNTPVYLHKNLLKRGSSDLFYWDKTDIPSEEKQKIFEQTKLNKLAYDLNFPYQLTEIMTEVTYLERFRFKIPRVVVNIMLQADIFIGYLNKIDVALYLLLSTLGSLSYAEASLLEPELEKLSQVIDPATDHLHWSSLGIPHFIARMSQAVDSIVSVVHLIKKIGQDTDSLVKSLASVKLFDTMIFDGEQLPMCELFFEELEREYILRTEDAVKIYKSLVPHLFKLEFLTCHTSSGKAGRLQEYYRHCEDNVLSALIKMMTTNLEYFKEQILVSYVNPYLEAAFNSSDELVKASIERTDLIFKTFLENLVKSLKLFLRWMDGTCIEASPEYDDEDELFEYTFFWDICLHPKINALVSAIYSNMRTFTLSIKSQENS